MHFRHHLCQEIRSAVSRQTASKLAAKEQAARVDSGIARTYWTVDQTAINEHIARRGNKSHAIESMQHEQVMRSSEHHMKLVCEELVRAVHRKVVSEASKNEQVQRITRDLVKDVCEELRRSAARKQALSTMDTE